MAAATWAALGLLLTMVSWFFAPLIASFITKFTARFGADTSKKLKHLEITILQELENTLPQLDEARVVERGKTSSELSRLHELAAMLRHAQEDAEDILHDHQAIKLYRNRWIERLCTMSTCVACFTWICVWIARIVSGGSAWLLQWFMGPGLVATAAVQATAVVQATATVLAASVRSGSSRLLPVTNFSAMAPSSSYFGVFKNLCRSTINRLLSVYNEACLQRNSCLKGVGITSKQGIIDCVITAISRHNLKKRIDEVESTVNDVKKSAALIISKSTLDVSSEEKSTLDVSSGKKSTLDISSEENSRPDIVKEKRSEIRTASNHDVFGLKKFRQSIMRKLRMAPQRSSTSSCYSAIGIYGLSGSGKTTFARYIQDHIKKECKDKKVFHTIMCIHVSNKFDVKEIFQNMLKDITNDLNANISDPVELEKKLEESLEGKRFFLILDDFWVVDKNNKDLKKLISVLKVGRKGSKILVTAQTKAAAGTLCEFDDEPVRMPVLSEDQCLAILMHYALGDTSVVDRDGFERAGRDIVKKIGRSPIAAAIVAVRLGAERDIKVWENTANLDMLSDTRAALWWSYKQFTPDIRRCFEYCNIFSKGIALEKGDVVSLWTAQGFVKTNGNEDMEAVAESYFQALLSFSFPKHEEDKWGGDFYRIHDMLHDLVNYITKGDCFRIEYATGETVEDKEQVVPRDVRHLFFLNYDAELIKKEIDGLDNLRTLIIYSVKPDRPVEEEVMENICKYCPKLRVLAVAFGGQIHKPEKFSFPESISRLKRLCYLAFRTGYSCEVICPSAFAELWHIRMLYFGHALLCNIGRLTSLQEMAEFRVMDKAGYELHQLGGLDKLRGTLAIVCLDNVNSQDEAVKANLSVKKGLRKLTLKWQCYELSQVVQPDHVLEILCPPMKLQELEIYNYNASAYPSWMENREKGGPKDLKHLMLWRFGQQGPPQFVEAFPRLRVLHLRCCSWDALPGNMRDLTSLVELMINACPNIRSLPTLPQSVLSFDLQDCNVEFMKSCREPGHENYEKVKHLWRRCPADPRRSFDKLLGKDWDKNL
ncbi:hypothetical protein CFC21_045065 [Triticum aestivum]|uniref:AAA+ ATPase domain-containing protein n=3 Tax=Triticum TaxID=4564 RepID=A0A9R1SAN5_TRITD|nr:disease resistance protein RGA2-like [Triticum aestivum]KAF7034006.1 hypothetical protein CFC21_045065 [Triticum aestivum]VAH86617.1 unnamed protein product [Triticum turgidum subsp. durum]